MSVLRSQPAKARPVHWRFSDNPRPGTIYRLPDDLTLQRGITYTFLPDGRSIRVPAMNRLEVRAAAQGHQENEDTDIVEALQQLLSGKRPTAGKAAFDGVGRANRRRPGRNARNRPDARGPAARNEVQGAGMRGMMMEDA